MESTDNGNSSVSLTLNHSPPSALPGSSEAGAKRKRIGRACDFCNRRAIKCVPTEEGKCQSCINFGVDKCTYDRPAKKRGPPKATEANARSTPGALSKPAGAGPCSNSSTISSSSAQEQQHAAPPSDLLHPLNEMAPVDSIIQLLNIFHSSIYPIFPYIHYPKFAQRIRDLEHTRSKSFYAAVMALCALTAARIRDKAVFSEQIQSLPASMLPSDVFFTAAATALPKNLVDETEFDYTRAAGLLALTALQNGQPTVMRQYFSRLHALTSIQNLDDESRWPPSISRIEFEERRRVFWSIYQMDVYACVIWGGTVRVKESQVSVAYPTEVNDEYISDSEPYITTQPEGTTSWVQGWNRVTDMYRVLEYSLDRFRAAQLANHPSPTSTFRKNVTWASVDQIYDQLDNIFHSLPTTFQEAHPRSVAEDIYLFQSTNVIVTWHMAKMVAIGADDLDVPKRCQVINDLLTALHGVPPAYFACMSCPLLFHLVGIVQILGNIITGPLSPSIFRQVRTAMIRMADILQAIEGRLSFTAGASQRLRDQVARLDRYMENSTSFSDAFIKAPNYFDFVANRNPVDLMSVPNLRPFDEASPSDATAPTTSPASTLQDLWPGLTTAASSNPITSATDLASAYSAVDSAAATSAAPLSSTGQAAGNPQTIQLPDSVLQPFTGDFSQNIFPQWLLSNWPNFY